MTMSQIVNADFDQDNKPNREEAEEAVRTLLRWIGEDPNRPGLVDTPKRVINSYDEFYSGYKGDAIKELSRTFEDIEGYDDMVIIKDIDFISKCEHHMVTILGRASVAYWPNEKVVGISKLARVVDIFSKRLVSQEKLTKDIVDAIDKALAPKGVAVLMSANHQCMSTRGVSKAASATVTSMYSGVFKEDADVRRRFLELGALSD